MFAALSIACGVGALIAHHAGKPLGTVGFAVAAAGFLYFAIRQSRA